MELIKVFNQYTLSVTEVFWHVTIGASFKLIVSGVPRLYLDVFLAKYIPNDGN